MFIFSLVMLTFLPGTLMFKTNRETENKRQQKVIGLDNAIKDHFILGLGLKKGMENNIFGSAIMSGF